MNEPDRREELRVHLEMEIEAGVRRGLTRAEAQRQARLKHGSPAAALEAVRDARSGAWFADLAGEFRQAARVLWRRPGFAVTTVVALATAVAVVTLVFALVEAVLWRPLPYREPERLVRVYNQEEQSPRFPISIGRYLDYRQHAQTLAGIGLYTRLDLQLMHGDRPQRLTALRVTPDFFSTLGVQPMLGRNFALPETKGYQRLAILSHRLWKREFGGAREIIGRQIRLDREAWTVIGVMPAGFQHVGGHYRSTAQGETVDLWTPLRLDIGAVGLRHFHYTNAVARLRPGATPAEAQAEMARILQRTENNPRGMKPRVAKLDTEIVGESRSTVWLLALAGAVVWLTACANVAGLCLARGLAREREMAVRQALGAGAARVARAVLAENLLLGAVGLALGLLLCAALLPALRWALPESFPRLHELHLNGWALAFASASALTAALAAGLAPAWRQARLAPGAGLAVSNRSSTASRPATRLRGGLVAGEIALAALLCVFAGLLARSAFTLSQRDHGFEAARVLTFQVNLPPSFWSDAKKTASFYRQARERFSALPGVQHAGFATNLPWSGYDENTGFSIVGRRLTEEPSARFQAASPGYFQALRFRLRGGRFFDERDRADGPLALIVNAAFAQRYLAGENALGHQVEIWGKRYAIVGVVDDVRDQPAHVAAVAAFWFPMDQQPFHVASATVQTAGDPLAAVPAVGRALRDVDPELAMSEIRSMEDTAAAALAESRFALWTFEALGALTLLLAALGIYGLLAYWTSQRRREFGVRLVLGASRASLVRLVLRGGLMLALVGLSAAALLLPVALPLLRQALYGISPWDPWSLAGAFVAVLMVAGWASLIPALAALRPGALAALREE